MSGGPACPNKDPEHVAGHHVVTQYRENHSTFSRGGHARSDWSEVACFTDQTETSHSYPAYRWRTKAAYVERLRDATNQQRLYGVVQTVGRR